MPFFSLLRIDGFDKAVGFNEVLVKLLFNEQETSIPAIGPDHRIEGVSCGAD